MRNVITVQIRFILFTKVYFYTHIKKYNGNKLHVPQLYYHDGFRLRNQMQEKRAPEKRAPEIRAQEIRAQEIRAQEIRAQEKWAQERGTNIIEGKNGTHKKSKSFANINEQIK